jgi:hypothetical protein
LISVSIDYNGDLASLENQKSHLNHIFDSLKYCTNLEKLEFNFAAENDPPEDEDIEIQFNPVNILSQNFLHLKKLKHLSLILHNTPIGNHTREEEGLRIEEIMPYENILLDFLNSCNELTHFEISGNFISCYFQDKLNTCLKNLPKIQNVALEYTSTGEDFKPISEILKNPSITDFSFKCSNFWPTETVDYSLILDDSEYLRPFELPATQLNDAQQTLSENRTLRHLTLDFKEAFEASRLMTSYDQHDPDVFIMHHFLNFCSALTSMYHLENLVFHLPENLEAYLDSEEFKTNLLDCFKYSKGIENITIDFPPLATELNEISTYREKQLTPAHQLMKAEFRDHCLFRNSNYDHASLSQHSFLFLTLEEMTTTDMIRYDVAVFSYLSSYFHARKPLIEVSFISRADANLFMHFCNGIIERLLSANNLPYRQRRDLPSAFILSYLTPAEILKITMSIGGLLRSQKSNWPALTTAPIIANMTHKP